MIKNPKVILIIILTCFAFGAVISCTDPLSEHMRLSSTELANEVNRQEALVAEIRDSHSNNIEVKNKAVCTSSFQSKIARYKSGFLDGLDIQSVSDESLKANKPLTDELIKDLGFEFLAFETCISDGQSDFCPLFNEPWFNNMDSLNSMLKANSFGASYLFFQNLELQCNICGYRSIRLILD